MSGFQRYLFRNVLRTLLAIVGGLALIAVLTQGLAQDRLDLIVENRQSVVVYLWVTTLATPQIISLLMPIALFIATALATIVNAASGSVKQAIILYEAALGVGIATGPLLGGWLGGISWRWPLR